jgi:hypothetical protein
VATSIARREGQAFGTPRPAPAPHPLVAPLPNALGLPTFQPEPLPNGLPMDPTYASFLRGAGMDARTAEATALSHIAAIRAQYRTNIQRDPAVLKQDLENTDNGYLSNGDFFSGHRLVDENKNQVADLQRRQDYSTAEGTGISGERTALQQHLSDLARQNADQIGQLQGRHNDLINNDRYIQAVNNQANADALAAQATAAQTPVLASALQGLIGGTTPPTPAPAQPPAPKPNPRQQAVSNLATTNPYGTGQK